MTHHDPHSESADAVHEGRPVDAQYVRGARPGRRILWLLIVSGGAAAILLLGMWFVSNGGFASQNANVGGQAVDAAAFDNSVAPRPDAPTTTTGQPAPTQPGTQPNVNPPAN
jgi:hypothetical protein